MLKTVKWIGSSKDDLSKFPKSVKETIGFALYQAQKGESNVNTKPLKHRGVMEIVDYDRSGAFRLVYTTEIKDIIYVLHVFQKKSKKGIATPLQEINLIKQRLKEVKALKR